MTFQHEISPFTSTSPQLSPEPAAASEVASLLRQILEVQREQLAFLRAAHDATSRWRAFLNRWRQDFPDLSQGCRQALPILEKSYGALLADLADYLHRDGADSLDNDFALQEFLDRFGMRLAQLGTLLNLVAPLADASSQGESS